MEITYVIPRREGGQTYLFPEKYRFERAASSILFFVLKGGLCALKKHGIVFVTLRKTNHIHIVALSIFL
jgi:hypothetical protein